MNEDVAPISSVKAALEDAGFETSWRRPFWTWMHPESRENDNTLFHAGSTLFVTGLPMPEGVPADLAEAEMHFYDDRFYFCFTLYFYTVLKNALEVEDFKTIHGQHDREWFPKLQECYFDAAFRFMLKWDIEYDESIEDSLYVTLEPDEAHLVTDMVRALSDSAERRGRAEG